MTEPMDEMQLDELLMEEDEEYQDEDLMEEQESYKIFGNSKALPISQEKFDVLGIFESKEIIRKFIFSNRGGLFIEVMNFGATVLSIRMPDKYGNTDDVLLGFDTVQEYYEHNCKFGALIGRTCNIIEDANFHLNNQLHFLRKNFSSHHKDGGVRSFDKVIWKSNIDKATNTLVLSYLSEHEEEGYPGNLLTRIFMKLSDENEFLVTITAACDEMTPVDISQKLFFNLAGHATGEMKMKNHKVMINAEMYIMKDKQGIATSRLKHVNQTYFDLRMPRPFYSALNRIRGGGYDHTFCLNKSHRDSLGLVFAGRLEEHESGRFVELWTDAPGINFYTANNFPTPIIQEYEDLAESEESLLKENEKEFSSGGIRGKGNFQYFRHGAAVLSPQGYPNSVNIPMFPSCIMKPHKTFQRKIIYKFGVSNKISAPSKITTFKENNL